MTEKERLLASAEAFTASSHWNRVSPEEAISPQLAGVQIYDAPLMGCSDAADGLYRELQRPEVVGPQLILPEGWLPGARTVVSLFFPFTEAVRRSNTGGALPSPLWLHGRIEGQRFLSKLAEHLAGALEQAGYRAVVPVLSSQFRINDVAAGMPFGSNWSERHAAFISGLGTFCLSKGLITEKGVAGRFISLVTDAVFQPTPRPYTDIYEFCTKCGACARRCPVDAISLEGGKEHPPCSAYQKKMGKMFSPRYGCGKCQVGVPCEARNPSSPR